MSLFPLGRVFGRVATTYDEVRPPYPAALWPLLDGAVGGLPGARVFDVAAGTGFVTRELLARGASVIACEPDADLLIRLRSRSPGVPAVRGVAEALPLQPATVDLVTCGTAWHWFDAGAAAGEVARVLRDGGSLALFWANHRHGDGVDWEQAQSAVYDSWQARPGSLAADPQLGVRPDQAADDLRDRGWTVTVDTVLEWERTVTREQHLAVLSTHSVVLGLGDDAPAFLAEVGRALQPWPVVTERLHGAVVVATPPASP